MPLHLSPLRAGSLLVLSLALAALALPGFAAQTQPPEPPAPPAAPDAPPPPPPPPPPSEKGHTVSIHSGGLLGLSRERTRIEVDDDASSYSADIDGKFAFNERDDDLASLADGGSASFSSKQEGVVRRIDYSNKGGTLERHYFVDGREQPIDAAARSEIAAMLVAMARESAIDAERRVRHLYTEGGADAVLADVEKVHSGYARSTYLKALMPLGTLSPAQVTRALRVVDGIDSGYERRQALAAIGAAATLDAGQQRLVLAEAGRIDSDYERAELLIGLLPTLADDAQVHAAWLQEAAKVESAYEHRRVLSALLAARPLDDATLSTIIDAAGRIDSDYERRELLGDTIKHVGNVDAVAARYTAGVDGLGSAYERREALLALIHGRGFGVAGARAVLASAAKIDADYECREVLVALAAQMPHDAALIEEYRGVARRLSDYERGTAERALDRFAG